MHARTMIHRCVAIWLVVVPLLWLGAAPVHAHPDLDSARRSFEEGSFATALARLDRAQADPSLSRVELVQLRWLRAASLYAMGRRGKANGALDELLEMEPLFEPSAAEASPPLRDALQKRRAGYMKRHGVTVGAPQLEDAPQMSVALGGHAGEAAQVVVFARARGSFAYQPFTLKLTGSEARGVLEDPALWRSVADSGGLELVVEVRNSSQGALARLGTATQPHVEELNAEVAQRARATLVSLQTPPAPAPQPVAPPSQTPPPAAQPSGVDTQVAAVTKPPADVSAPEPPAPVTPAGSPEARDPPEGSGGSGFKPGRLTAGLLGGVAVAAGLPLLLALVTSGAGYAAIWLHPRAPGTEVSPTYRLSVAAWLGGLVFGGLTAVAVLVLCAAAVAVGVVSVATGL